MILDALSGLFRNWVAEVTTLAWLALALVAAIVEVSIPHFGFHLSVPARWSRRSRRASARRSSRR